MSLNSFFEKLQPLIVEMIGQYNKLPEYIMFSLVQSMATLNDHALSIRLNDTLPSQSYALVVARVWIRFEREGITTFEKRLKGLGENINMSSLFKTSKIDQSTKDVKDGIRETAQQLLQYFVRIEGEKLGMFVRRYIETTNWMTRREPWHVEMIIDTLMGELISLKTYLQRIFATEDIKLTPLVGKRPQPGFLPNKMHLFSRIEFDRGSILTAILKVCLKTFLECVRLVTFGNYGYQQIQVNVHFLRIVLTQNNVIEDKSQVLEMIDEIVVSAEERTVDAAPMETFIIERICDEKLKNPSGDS